MHIEETQILQVIDATPLVSVDLIIKNHKNQVLLGKRVNRPAKGYWFVPGGRIKKNEKITDALGRISLTEINHDLSTCNSNLLGVYDHIYDDNFMNKKGINTHYVVIAFVIEIENELKIKPDDQHSEVKWWSMDNLLEDPGVHQNTKAYFQIA